MQDIRLLLSNGGGIRMRGGLHMLIVSCAFYILQHHIMS